MEFYKISHLLSRVKELLVSHDTIKKETERVILEKTSIKINPDNLSIHGGTIFIEDTPGVKSVIFIKKEPILAELKKTLQTKAPINIR